MLMLHSLICTLHPVYVFRLGNSVWAGFYKDCWGFTRVRESWCRKVCKANATKCHVHAYALVARITAQQDGCGKRRMFIHAVSWDLVSVSISKADICTPQCSKWSMLWVIPYCQTYRFSWLIMSYNQLWSLTNSVWDALLCNVCKPWVGL